MNAVKIIGGILGVIACLAISVLAYLFLCWLGMVIFTAFGVGGLSFACVLIIAAALFAKN